MLSSKIRLDTEWTTKEDRSTTNISKLARLIQHDVKFAKDESGTLYYFDEGVYKPKGKELVAELYLQLLEQFDSLEDWKPKKSQDIVEYILIQSPNLKDRPPKHIINLKNGLFNLDKQTLHKHSPAYYNVIQIPITYDPDAHCPSWDRFLSEVLPYPGGPNYLREIIGICMTPFTRLQKCIILVGAGSNGKSTFLNGLQSAIGHDNICNIPLHSLTNPMERFSRSGLVGKLVNIFGDMSTKKIEDAANFKPLVGEDRILIESKHKDAYYYTPFCKLIFSCNEVVRSDDDSEGYRRRFVHIPFTQRFKVDPKIGEELSLSLSDPKELSGLLNYILPLIPNVMENGLTLTNEIAGIIDEWVPIPDAIRSFLLDNLVLDPNSNLPMQRYYDWHSQNAPCIEPFERVKLVKYVKLIFPEIQASHVAKVNGLATRCYKGIRCKDLELQNLICSWVNRENSDAPAQTPVN